MSILIDKLIDKNKEKTNQVMLNGRWFIAKPIHHISFRNKIVDAARILIGKSFAYHYYEDQ